MKKGKFCTCGLDESKNGLRFDVVCPKHDGYNYVSSQATITSGAYKTEDDMDPQEEGDEKSTN